MEAIYGADGNNCSPITSRHGAGKCANTIHSAVVINVPNSSVLSKVHVHNCFRVVEDACRGYQGIHISNLALNARRKNQRYALVDDKLEELTEPVEPDVWENFEDQLRLVMETLPTQQQEVLLLRFVDEHSLNEIAEILEIPPGTVKSRLHNALRALAENPRTKTYFEKE